MLRGLRNEPAARRRWIVVAFALALSFVPLFGTLGYEHAFVLSPVLALAGVGAGVDARRRAGRAPTARAAMRSGLLELSGLLGLVLGLSIVALLWQTNCDPWGGMLFFAMGPVLSGSAGVVAGLWGGLLAGTRRRQLAMGVSIVLASTAIGAWRLIADPVVFAFDPFWGYFSGAIYDEDVGIRGVYLRFRAYNVLAMAAALQLWALAYDPSADTRRSIRALGAAVRGRPAAGAAAIVGAVAAVAIGITGARWGFTANIDTITGVLTGVRHTEHFIIHYTPKSAEARTIDAVAAEHELAWDRLARAMDGRAPEGKIRSFVFANPGQKRALMGAGVVQVAAPWRGQIYLDHRPFPHPVLHHELAHVFGRTIGDAWFGVARRGLHLNIALIEGFATAMAPRPADHLDLHDQALVLERLGRRPSLPSIMGPSFFAKSSRVAYTAAGSFCQWLIDTRGFDAMATLYFTAGDFETAYGESLPALEAQWLAFLETRGGVTEADVESQRQRFMRRSVFRRPCAHRAANVAAQIRHAGRRGDRDGAVALYRTLCSIEPEDPAHKLGLARAYGKAGDLVGALAVLAEAAAVPDLTVTLKAALASSRAEVALAAGELTVAAQTEREALRLPMARSAQRTHQLRLTGAEDPALAPVVLRYLAPFATDDDGVAAAMSRLYAAIEIAEIPGYRALGSYLVARQLLNVQDPRPAVALLQTALDPPPGDHGLPSPQFVRAAHIALLSAAVQSGQTEAARAALTTLARLPDSGHGDALVLADWQERVEFFANFDAAG